MTMYYQNSEMAPFDAAFEQQIGLMTTQNQITGPLAQAIARCWQNSKQQLVQQLKYQYQNLGGYNQAIIANAVNGFIMNTGRAILQQNQQNNFGNPFGLGGFQMQQPLMTNGVNNNFSAISFPINNGVAQQNQPMYAEVNTTPQAAKPVTQQETKSEQQPSPVKTSFVDPVKDEPDNLYGDKVLSTSLGELQVTSFRDGYGQPVKYVEVKLTDACFDNDEAISRAKRLYTKDLNYHIDIKYDKLDKLPVPYATFKEFVDECKKFVESSPAENGNLKYLQGIQKVLNGYPRGIADAIDEYMCDRFNWVAGASCNTSMALDRAELRIGKFSSLIELSNRDSGNATVQNWYKIDNFKEQFALACNMAIREFFLNVTLLDPNDPENMRLLMRANSGLIESADLSLIDVTNELFDRRSEFCSASAERKMTDFGNAGKELMNSVVFVLGGQRVTVTKLIPEGVAGRSHGTPLLLFNNIVFGGYDEKGKPVECSSLFEYFMVYKTMTNIMYTDLVVEFKEASIKYGCSRCTDGALVIKTEK